MSASQAEHAGSIPVTCSSSETLLLARSPAFRRGFLAGRGVSSLPNRTRLRWASIWGTLGTSEQASYRLLRLFSKVRVRSFRCSSFSSRKRSAGLRLEDLERRIFCQYIKKAGNLFRGSLQCVYLLYARKRKVTIWALVQSLSAPNRPSPMPPVTPLDSAQATASAK